MDALKNFTSRNVSALTVLLAIALVACVVVLYYVQLPFIEGIESTSFDLRFKTLRGPLKTDDRFAIVAIDDKSIDELGRFPWSREWYPKLIDKVSAAGAKALIMDAFFPEPQDEAIDKAFGDSVRRSGITTLAVAFEFNDDGTVRKVISSIPSINDGAKAVAHINVWPEVDGVIRWSPLVINVDGTSYPSLGLAAAMEALGARQFKATDQSVEVDGISVPLSSGLMLVNYVAPPGSYKLYSFTDIVHGRVPDSELRGKVLFLGATALGIYDMRVTPFSGNTPGVEVNVNVADSIVNQRFIRRSGLEALMDIIFIVLLGTAACAITMRMRASVALPLVIVIGVGYVYLSYYLFLQGHWVSMVYPILSLTAAFSISGYFRFFYLDKKAKEIRNIFSSYVSKNIVDEIMKHPDKINVGGENKVITIMFADIRNYTTYSEKRRPDEVVKTLNEYLSEMVNAIMSTNGTLDKFLGDGILAYWGAPIDQPNHAELAVRGALQMLERLAALQEKWKSEGTEPFACGIGINTGEVVVGNIGAVGKKMEYTVIGDNVNLTYRIQNESRAVNKPVITDSTYNLIKDIVDVEYMGPVMVKGKANPIYLYAINGMKGETPLLPKSS